MKPRTEKCSGYCCDTTYFCLIMQKSTMHFYQVKSNFKQKLLSCVTPLYYACVKQGKNSASLALKGGGPIVRLVEGFFNKQINILTYPSEIIIHFIIRYPDYCQISASYFFCSDFIFQ